MSTPSHWRVASRLARRETLRRPGRTALVALLIAVPVAGMTVANVLARTLDMSWAENFALSAGDSDLVLTAGHETGIDDGFIDSIDHRLGAALPVGSTWEVSTSVWADVRTATRSISSYVTDISLAAPIQRSAYELLEGRAPQRSDEVAIDPHSASAFGVGVGDTLRLEHPRGLWSVSGIVRSARWFGQGLFIVDSFDWDRARSGGPFVTVAIDVPDDVTIAVAVDAVWREFGPELSSSVASLSNRIEALDQADLAPPTVAIAWGWVLGAVALAVLGVIISAAFATSARRQLVAMGQLAANGADRSMLRLALALQGSWSGVVGVVTGLALAACALPLGRPLIELVAGHRMPSYEVGASDLVMIATIGVAAATLAALVPARTLARVPVMSALGGRRPLGRVPRRMVAIGVALFAAGLFLLVLAATAVSTDSATNGDLWALVSVLGGLGVLGSLVCAAPLVVDVMGRVCTHLPGAWRLGGRSLARTRARSAGVVAALASMTALAVAGTTMWSTAARTSDENGTWMPRTMVLITDCTYEELPATDPMLVDPPTPSCVRPDDELVHDVVGVLDARPDGVFERRSVTWDPAPFDQRVISGGALLTDGEFVIADPHLLDQIGLDPVDRATLDEVGAMRLVGQDGVVPDQPVDATIETQDGRHLDVRVAWTTHPFESHAGTNGLLITPDAAQRLGLPIEVTGVVVTTAAPISLEQSERLQGLSARMWSTDVFDAPAHVAADPTQGRSIVFDQPVERHRLLAQIAIASVATLLTLIVVAIGLALSAIESRDERDVLSAIGASPRVLRSVAARKAYLMSATGALVALPAGLVPVAVVLHAVDRDGGSWTSQIDVPWATLAVLVAGVPLVAAACTGLTSMVAQRVRPTTMSTLRAD